jgi:putative addiction module CopG family antidote
MLATSSMTVSLSPELSLFITAKVATGHCRNASAVVREALRLLAQQDRRNASPHDTSVEVEDRRGAR